MPPDRAPNGQSAPTTPALGRGGGRHRVWRREAAQDGRRRRDGPAAEGRGADLSTGRGERAAHTNGGGTKWLRHPPAIEVPGSGLYHPGRGGNKGGGSPFSLCPGRVGDPSWGGKRGEADCTSPAGGDCALLPPPPLAGANGLSRPQL